MWFTLHMARISVPYIKELAQFAAKNSRTYAAENSLAVEAHLAKHRIEMKSGRKVPQGGKR